MLAQAHPGTPLPRPTAVPDTTPTGTRLTPETYLGYRYAPLHVTGAVPARDTAGGYGLPPSVERDTFGLGGTWTSTPEALVAGPDARLELNFQAREVYAVLAGNGTVRVILDGRPGRTIEVSGVPTLYPLANGRTTSPQTLELSATPGVEAYDFTFG